MESLHQKTNYIWVSDQVPHKPSCTATENSKKLEISDLERISKCSFYGAKTKTLISCAVAAQRFFGLVSIFADCCFANVVAQIIIPLKI